MKALKNLKHHKFVFWLRCIMFGKETMLTKYMKTKNKLLKEINEINLVLIPMLNSYEKDTENCKSLSKKRNELREELKNVLKNLYRYHVEYNYVTDIMNSNFEDDKFHEQYYYSEVNVMYDSKIEGLNPQDSFKKKLVSDIFKEIFNTNNGLDLS